MDTKTTTEVILPQSILSRFHSLTQGFKMGNYIDQSVCKTKKKPSGRHIKMLFFFFFICSIIYGTMVLHLSHTGSSKLGKSGSPVTQWVPSSKKAAPMNSAGLSRNSTGMACHLPLLNPFDPSIAQFNTDPPNPNVSCPKNKDYPLLFTTDLRSTLIQVNNPEKYDYTDCCYKSFVRKEKSESITISKKCLSIVENKTVIPENIEFIQVECTNSSDKKRVVDVFGFVHLKKTMFETQKFVLNGKNKSLASSSRPFEHPTTTNISAPLKDKEKGTRRVNVVILGLDAVSHMNFIRVMPLTYKYLTNNLSVLGLWGYTKLGDNTFPNIVPATTGLFVEELNTTGNCYKNKSDSFDNCPFIWKNYSSQGYTTAYGEDATWMGIFSYAKHGFDRQPTDYYFNTLGSQQDKKTGHVHMWNANLCYGPRLGFQTLLLFLKQMAVAMNKKKRYFQFIWATSLFHDYLNNGKLGDRLLLETLQWFKREGYFEDTVMILMSDHGIRWGGIRNTLQGKIEERMPFLYFAFPKWFRERYRSAVSNVIANKHRLTTPLDLHETLKDLLFLDNIKSDNIRDRHLNLQDKLKQSGGLPRGISLFLPIPLERTCKNAQIPDHFCVCRSTMEVTLQNNSLVREAARSIVHHINGMFVSFPQCLDLQLKEILNAQVFQSENTMVADASINITSSTDPQLDKQQVTLSLTLTVSPSDATFEATTTRHTNGTWTGSGDISRTNLYGEQSRCVTDYNLKKFCYCG